MDNEANRSRFPREQPDFKRPIFNDLEFLLGSSITLNTDDGSVQFETDQFVSKQFCVPPSKKKRTKESFKGLAEAIARLGHVKIQTSSGAGKENNNYNKQERGPVEETDRRIVESLRIPERNDSTVRSNDPVKIKANESESLLKDGFEAYRLGQYAMAAAKYKSVCEMLADVTLKSRLENIEDDVVCYMLCMSLLETDQLSNLSEAVELLFTLEKRSSNTLPAVHYALSKAHRKHYRYELALKSIEKGFAVLDSDAQLTEYKIPGTDVILKESTRDGLSISLAAMKDECSKWHPPDALCCASECVPTSRWYGPSRNIYFSDPAFNGMVVLTCSYSRFPCTIKFHQACWKSKKDQLSAVKKLSDKDIIGQECFTPNCEYNQGEHSVISKVEVYGDDGKLKTHIEAPANPVVWAKRRPVPKGAIPKQPVKSKRHSEKTRRPVVNVPVPSPRINCKESPDEDCFNLKRAKGLSRLAKLRQNNFGIKPDCEWRPDLAMYGNPQIIQLVDFLGGPVFENDSSRISAARTFIFTYFYEYIKDNGYVSKKDISRRWEEDKYTICSNYNDVLRDNIDIFDFLLQSYKLVSIGAYICIAENLPELYSVVQSEVCSYLRFSLADSVRPSIPIVQDDFYNTAISDFDEKRNKDLAKVSADTEKMETMTNETREAALPSSDSATSEPKAADDSQETSSEAVLTNSNDVNGALDSQELPSEKPVRSLSLLIESETQNDCLDLREFFASPLLSDETFVSEDSIEPSDSLVRPILISGEGKKEEDGALDNECENNAQITESIDSEERVSSKESDIRVLSVDENLTIDEIEPNSDPNLVKSLRIDTTNDGDSTEVKPAEEVIPSAENCTSSAIVTENEKDTAQKNGSVEKLEEPPEAEINSGVNKSEKDMTTMIETITELKFSLEENKAITENYKQMMEREFIKYKMLSETKMTKLTEDLKRSEDRIAKQENRRKELAWQIETCQRELRQTIDENVVLKLEKTELVLKCEKLNEEKVEMEKKFDVLLKKNTEIKNELLALQKEREKMYKKLEKYQACIKEQVLRDSKQTESSQQTKETQPEKESSEDVRKLSERKARIESLDQEFLINNILLDKAYEKCHDHIRMYNDVEKLLTTLQRQQFLMVEALEPWHKLECFVHQAIDRNKMDYAKFKALLESNEPIENFDDIKLHMPQVVFPKLPSLTDIYYNRERVNRMLQYVHGTTTVAMPVTNPQNPFSIPHYPQHYFPPSPQSYVPLSQTYYPGVNIDPRFVCHTPSFPSNQGPSQDLQAGVVKKAQAERMHEIEGRSSNNNIKDRQRFIQKTETFVPKEKIVPQKEASPLTVANDSTDNRDNSVGKNPFDNASQVPINKQSILSKKIGTDSLVQRMKKKYEGIPELDLLESVEELRKKHKNSLTGMRVEDIIRETEPLVKSRQEKHMASYSPPVQRLPRERSVTPVSKPNQRKIPPLMPPGHQRKKTKSLTVEPTDYFGTNSFDLPSSSKKSAWESVPSAFVDWKKNDEDSECSICFESMIKFVDKNPVYTLPCKHSFHTACIKTWLGENSVCPICRIHCTMDDEFPPLP